MRNEISASLTINITHLTLNLLSISAETADSAGYLPSTGRAHQELFPGISIHCTGFFSKPIKITFKSFVKKPEPVFSLVHVGHTNIAVL